MACYRQGCLKPATEGYHMLPICGCKVFLCKKDDNEYRMEGYRPGRYYHTVNHDWIEAPVHKPVEALPKAEHSSHGRHIKGKLIRGEDDLWREM